jgi:macrolide transport system ATP-binding/permease protein
MPEWKPEIRNRVAGLKLDPTREAEIVEEVAQHLNDRYEELVASGMTEETACRHTVELLSDSDLLARELRRVEQPVTKPIVLGTPRRTITRDVWQDLRYGFRMLRKSPGFTTIAILSLSLGIGANTAIFSLANAVLLRALPVMEPDRLVTISSAAPGRDRLAVSYPDYLDFRDRNEVLSGLLCWGELPLSVSTGGQAEQVTGMLVSTNYFSVLGVTPAQGRFFGREFDGDPADSATVISFSLWQRRFGGDPEIVGRSVFLNGNQFTIIGVAPKGFTSTMRVFAPDAWVPVTMQPKVIPQSQEMLTSRGARWLSITGRLMPPVSIAQAEANLSSIEQKLAEAYPERNQESEEGNVRGWGVKLSPAGSFPPRIRAVLIGFLGLLFALAGLVLLIACANLSSLLLARSLQRRKEFAVRLALGASRFRILRQLLVESVMLCVLSGIAGVLVAVWMNRLLLAFQPSFALPFEFDLRLDLRVLSAAFLLSLVTGIVFGLLPALQASRPDVVRALKEDAHSGGRRASRLRNAFVVGQVAMSMLLLIVAGLFLRALAQGSTQYQGLDPEHVQTATIDPRFLGYDEQRTQEFYRQLLEHVRALPGVEVAGLAQVITVGESRATTGLAVAGSAVKSLDDLPQVDFNVISSGYLATLKIGLLRGRDFMESDGPGAHRVAIIDETAARQWFAGSEPLGQRVTDGKNEYEIVGIAKRGNQRRASEAQPFVYLPYTHWHGDIPGSRLTLHLRTPIPASEVYAAIRQVVSELDSQMPLQHAAPLTEYIRLELLPQRLAASMAGALGLVGLALAGMGIFGVVSYAVTQRTHEIGIRMALGAQATDVLTLILRQGIELTLMGLGCGLLAAFALTRLLASLLYGVSATDPVTFLGVSLLLSFVTLLASYLPARRATKTDPMEALRYE